MKRTALIALSLFFAGRGFCETPAANSDDDQLQKLAQDFLELARPLFALHGRRFESYRATGRNS